MERRTRSQKKLAQRLDLNYFKKSFPIPRWRRILSLALVVVGLAWLAYDGFAGGYPSPSQLPLALETIFSGWADLGSSGQTATQNF